MAYLETEYLRYPCSLDHSIVNDLQPGDVLEVYRIDFSYPHNYRRDPRYGPGGSGMNVTVEVMEYRGELVKTTSKEGMDIMYLEGKGPSGVLCMRKRGGMERWGKILSSTRDRRRYHMDGYRERDYQREKERRAYERARILEYHRQRMPMIAPETLTPKPKPYKPKPPPKPKVDRAIEIKGDVEVPMNFPKRLK